MTATLACLSAMVVQHMKLMAELTRRWVLDWNTQMLYVCMLAIAVFVTAVLLVLDMGCVQLFVT